MVYCSPNILQLIVVLPCQPVSFYVSKQFSNYNTFHFLQVSCKTIVLREMVRVGIHITVSILKVSDSQLFMIPLTTDVPIGKQNKYSSIIPFSNYYPKYFKAIIKSLKRNKRIDNNLMSYLIINYFWLPKLMGNFPDGGRLIRNPYLSIKTTT